MSDLIIAKVCHEANRAYCKIWGDDSQKPWHEAAEWQRDSAIRGVEAIRDRLDQGLEVTPEMSHENWMKQKLSEGWKYGEKKDEEAKTHPCLVSFAELNGTQQMKDIIFTSITIGMHKFYSKGE